LEVTHSKTKYLNKKCALVIVRDITEHKKHQIKQEVLEKCVENMNEAIAIMDSDTKEYLYLNEARENIYGYSNEILLKNGIDYRIENCIHPDDKEKTLQYYKTNKWPKKDQFRIIRPNGEIRWIESTYTKISYMEQKLVMSLQKDITIEKEANKTKELLEISIEAMTQGIVIVDYNTSQYLYLNKAIEKIYNKSKSNLSKMSAFEWIDKYVHPDDKDIQKKYYNNKSWPEKREYRILLSDNEVKYIRARLSPITTFQEKKCLIFIVEDRTKERISFSSK
jgi:PAS domain S-box-containing protein